MTSFQPPLETHWINKYGRTAPGSVIVPPGCGNSHRCPAVIITHGSPGDTFMDEDFEPEFPSQVFAAHGYVVLMVGESGIPPGPGSNWEQTKQNLGLDAVATMEAAAKSAVDNGTADPAKIGIMGFSRGAEVTQFAMSHSTMFGAASSGDGGGGTGGYWQLGVSGPPAQLLDGAYGGSPGDTKAQQHWKDMAPDLNADKINAPMLFQATDSTAQVQMQLYEYVKARKVPTELIAFPSETHEFNQPADRAAAMNRNVDWFDYWLMNRRDPALIDGRQYSRWDAMRAAWH